MSFFNRIFWKTLWEDRKISISVLGIAAVLLLAYILWKMFWFHFDRAWNWNLGGDESNTQEVVCAMVKPEHLTAEGLEICNDL